MNNIQIIYEIIEYIEGNLKNPLTVGKVADKAGYSLFYFTRLFNSIVKHSPYDYIIRRRLSEAAVDLANTKKKIIDIALDYQFNNPETFSRAFYKMFEILPKKIKNNNIDNLILKTKDTLDYLNHINSFDHFIPEIVELDEICFMGIIYMLSESEDMLEMLWKEFKNKVNSIESKIVPEKYLFLKLKSKKNKNSYVLQMLGVETETIKKVPVDVVAKIIPSNKYLKFIHKGKYSKINFTLDYIFQSWLPKSGCKIKSNFEMDCFSNLNEDLGNENSKFEIYLALA